jgi:hypothetical protein
MRFYKLTDENMQTYNNTQWVLNEWQSPASPDATANLCSKAWLHGYIDPVLAVLLNPLHANFDKPRLFEAEAEGEIKYDGQLKFGCQRMRIIKEIRLPKLTPEQRVKFAIFCALEVYQDSDFVTWANNWLNGSDRSAKSAKKAYYAASYAAYNATYAAYYAASWAYNAASNATYAADAAYHAAYWASNAASWASNEACYAASDAAWAAYNAASWAIKANPNIDLIKLAHEAIKE